MDELQRRILQLLDSAPHAKREIYALGDNPAEVGDALEALIDDKFVRRTGKSRWTAYERTKKATPDSKTGAKPIAAITADRRILIAYMRTDGSTGEGTVLGAELVTEIDLLLKKAA